jgi:DHA2 family multidrug resistance protein
MIAEDSGTKQPNPYLVLLVVSLSMVMSILDSTIVNVAIAKLQVALGESITAVQWVITAYLLTFSIMLSASGWIADNFGYKKSFMFGLALFTFGSFLCSISTNLPMLVISRVVQGLGGGLLSPIGMAHITRAFPKERLGMVMALFSIPNISASSFGPTLGGWIIDNFSWQFMFDINIPVGILGLILSSVILREHKSQTRTSFDIPCFLALAIAIASLLYALSNGNAAWNTDGWTSTLILAFLGISLTGFSLFVIFQKTANHPMIDFSLFRIYNFSLDTIVLFVFGLGVFGSDFLLPLYLQEGLGFTPTQAGSVFIPFGFAMIVASVIGGLMTDRLGPKIPGVLGILIRAYGMYRFTFLTMYSSSNEIIITVALLGTGMGLLMPPIQTVALFDIPPGKMAQAAALVQTARQLGGSFGVALLSTILVNRVKFHMSALGQITSSSSAAFHEIATRLFYHALAAGGGTLGNAMTRAQHTIMVEVSKNSFVRAIDDVYFITMIVSIVSSIPFFLLRTSANRPKTQTVEPALNAD